MAYFGAGWDAAVGVLPLMGGDLLVSILTCSLPYSYKYKVNIDINDQLIFFLLLPK